jgi:nucleoid-associated protein Lsr2
MATTEVITLHDDLDERISTGVETVTFYHPVTGVKLEIELGEANRKHFGNHIEKLAKYIEAAREVEVAPKKAVTVQKENLDKVREWARANGYTVGDRGRIKGEILNAYHGAMLMPPTTALTDPTNVEMVEVPTQAVVEAVQEQAEEVATEAPRELTEQEILDLLAGNPDAGIAELRELAQTEQN